jgi:hypothetical protein
MRIVARQDVHDHPHYLFELLLAPIGPRLPGNERWGFAIREHVVRKTIVAWLTVLVFLALLYGYTAAYHPEQLLTLSAFMPRGARLSATLLGLSVLLLISLTSLQTVRIRAYRTEVKQLNKRSHGLRLALTMSGERQREAEAAAHVMAGTDPEAALLSLYDRIAATERHVAAQKSHDDLPDLQARVQDIQSRQSALRAEIGKLIEGRRASTPVLRELSERQDRVEQALKELETLDGGKSLKERLAELMDDNANARKRTDAAKEALATLNRLRDELALHSNDLLALADRDTGIAAIIDLVGASQADLNRSLDKLELRDGEGLSVCVEKLLGDKRDVERRTAAITEQLATLREVQNDIIILDRKRTQLTGRLAEAEVDDAGQPISDRLTELTAFATEAQLRICVLQDLLRRLKELETVLSGSEAALQPLKNGHGGIGSLLSVTGALRNELTRSLDELESPGAQTSLSIRVEELIAWQRMAEARIAALNSVFKQLGAVETEIDALFTSVMGSLSAHAPIDAGGDRHCEALSADGSSRLETKPHETALNEIRPKISWTHIFHANGLPWWHNGTQKQRGIATSREHEPQPPTIENGSGRPASQVPIGGRAN